MACYASPRDHLGAMHRGPVVARYVEDNPRVNRDVLPEVCYRHLGRSPP
jgi:hypothetical protein